MHKKHFLFLFFSCIIKKKEKELRMKKKLILFDIDGTIFDNSKQIIPPSTIETLKQLKEKGHELAIATGRAYVSLVHIEPVMPLFHHYILINGQQIISQGKTIYQGTLETKVLKELLDSFETKKLQYGFRTAYGEKRVHVATLEEVKTKTIDVYQIWCYGKKEEIEEMKELHPEFDFLPWGNIGYDVVKKGRSKAQAIPILAEYLQIDMKDTIAVGDASNDVKMLKTVGLGIAMGNATDEAKKASKYVTSRIDEDGIFQAFLHFGMIEEKK